MKYRMRWQETLTLWLSTSGRTVKNISALLEQVAKSEHKVNMSYPALSTSQLYMMTKSKICTCSNFKPALQD